MSESGIFYEFAFRGFLAEQALDAAGRQHPNVSAAAELDLAQLVALDALDETFVSTSRRMSIVYTAIAAFEMSARKLLASVLLEQIGANWWDQCVPHGARKKAESRLQEEERIKWHGQRGGSLLDYTELGDLVNIIRNNWAHFEPYIPSIDWVASIFSVVERSRNVIMHSGELSREDVARVGINIRDWAKQVGA